MCCAMSHRHVAEEIGKAAWPAEREDRGRAVAQGEAAHHDAGPARHRESLSISVEMLQRSMVEGIRAGIVRTGWSERVSPNGLVRTG